MLQDDWALRDVLSKPVLIDRGVKETLHSIEHAVPLAAKVE